MQSLIFFSAIGVFCGWIVGALAYEAFHKRWIALLTALLAPIPVVYAIMGIGYSFMREETGTLGSLIYVGAILFALISPFSVLSAWFVCHRKSRPR